MKYFCLFVIISLLLLQGLSVKAENPVGTYLDLQTALSRAKSQPEKAQALVDMGRYYVLKPGSEFRDMQIARKYCEAAGKITEKLDNNLLEADRLFVLSLVEKESDHKPAGKEKILAAISLYQKANDPLKEGLALMELRFYYGLENPELDERIKIVGKALKLFVQAGDKLNQGHANLELGDLYDVSHKSDIAINYLRQAIDLYTIELRQIARSL